MTNIHMYLIRVVCLISSNHVLCNAINVLEDVAKLDFPYPCASTEVTLQRSNGRPFYSSANPEHIMYWPSRYELRNHTDSKSDICYLNLTINPVSRDDEGTFILMAYKDGAILPDYPRIGLRVDYPPGKASCEPSNEYVDGEWVKLHCQASVGTLPGQIVCYQDDMRLPSLTSPDKNDGTLSQVMLSRLAGLVYCCTSTFQQTKDRCECNDFRWNPILNTELNNIKDPWAAATEMADSATSFTQEDQEISSIHPNVLNTKTGKNTCPSCSACPRWIIPTASCLMALGYIGWIYHIYKGIKYDQLRKDLKKQLKEQSDTRKEDDPERSELKMKQPKDPLE